MGGGMGGGMPPMGGMGGPRPMGGGMPPMGGMGGGMGGQPMGGGIGGPAMGGGKSTDGNNPTPAYNPSVDRRRAPVELVEAWVTLLPAV